MTSDPNLYDAVTYPAQPYADTHPNRLATMALLHGLRSAPAERCRVLEVGCNAGANLIPMAYALRGSEFVGFDLAAAPIARGQAKIEALGLSNIRLLQADLMEAEQVAELAGTFDYIIAHGVYTWVPRPVRESLIAFCGKHLHPQGVAFVSYAALPGGYIRLLVRQVMGFRPTQGTTPLAGVQESIAFLKFIAESRPEGDGFRQLLEREMEVMDRRGPKVVFHDELAPAYEPISFRDFTSHAAAHGLRYFSEAEFPGPKDPTFHEATIKAIQELAGGDPLAQEQMLDCARMRMYRESLLCHAEAAAGYDLQADALRELYLSSQARSTEGSAAGARAYSLSAVIRIETQHPMTLAVLDYLIARAPEAVSFAEVANHLEEAGLPPGPDLLVLLLRLVIAHMVDLYSWKAPVSREVAEKPMADGLCRYDAATETTVVTPLHTVLSMADPIARQLLQLLDGTRDRAALLRDLAAALPDVPLATLADGLEPALQTLSQAGVLLRSGRHEG